LLVAVAQLLDQMSRAPATAEAGESIGPWQVRETVLTIGAMAAGESGEWQLSLDYTAQVRELHRQRGATLVQQAHVALNDYDALLRLGRIGEARDLLDWCRTVFENGREIAALALVFGALAEVEKAVGHYERAVDWGMDALRFAYLTAIPEEIVLAHHNFGRSMAHFHDYVHVSWTHWCAGAVIQYQTGGDLTLCLATLSEALVIASSLPPDGRSFEFVCSMVDRVEGVHFAQLVQQLPRRAPDGQSALDEVLRLAGELRAGS
jgi:hypothetical protein